MWFHCNSVHWTNPTIVWNVAFHKSDGIKGSVGLKILPFKILIFVIYATWNWLNTFFIKCFAKAQRKNRIWNSEISDKFSQINLYRCHSDITVTSSGLFSVSSTLSFKCFRQKLSLNTGESSFFLNPYISQTAHRNRCWHQSEHDETDDCWCLLHWPSQISLQRNTTAA